MCYDLAGVEALQELGFLHSGAWQIVPSVYTTTGSESHFACNILNHAVLFLRHEHILAIEYSIVLVQVTKKMEDFKWLF